MVGFLYWMIKTIRSISFSKFIAEYKFCLLLILFSAMAFGALSILINNFGIIARIRMPMYIVLLCVMALSFEGIISDIKKIKKQRS